MKQKSAEYLKQNKVDSFENLKVVKGRSQAPNLKKILTKAEFSQERV